MLTTIALMISLQVSPARIAFFNQFGDERWESRVTDEMLARTPVWIDDAPSPPLPVRLAIGHATEQLRLMVSDPNQSALRQVTLEASLWRLKSISLQPVGDQGRWIYIVEYLGPAPPRQIDGPVPLLRIVVLMNGEVVAPTRTARSSQ
jgi:hypothetical protein